jgi:hypothetical protein
MEEINSTLEFIAIILLVLCCSCCVSCSHLQGIEEALKSKTEQGVGK